MLDLNESVLEPVDREALILVGRQLQGIERLGVAISGGVDSSTLLALAVHVLGPDRVLAILGVSASLSADEHEDARRTAGEVGVHLVEVPTRELDRPMYVANNPDRCFHCKDELFTRIDDWVVAKHELTAIAYGENADDVRRHDRPGAKAATDHGVLRPLAEAGLSKQSVRRIARAFGLSCADKPSSPCLASRIPHFAPVTSHRLGQVERAEAAVRSLGFSEFRVRHHDAIARIEFRVDDMHRAALEPTRSALLVAIREAGFSYVTIDLAGIQSGELTLGALSRDAR